MRALMISTLLAAMALPALAAERCDVPKDKWRPVAELESTLTAKGWTIKKVKTEDGCYEVYGKDEHGKRVEIFFDPATFAEMGSDD